MDERERERDKDKEKEMTLFKTRDLGPNNN